MNDGVRHMPCGAPVSDSGGRETEHHRRTKRRRRRLRKVRFERECRNPDGAPIEPTLMATTMASGGVSLSARSTRKKTNRRPVIIRKSRCAFSK